MNIGLLKAAQTLGFGGLLGAGLFGTCYSVFFAEIMSGVSLTEFMMIGASLGAGTSQAVERFTLGILQPMSSKVAYYSSIAELHIQMRLGLINSESATEILEELTRHHFLSEASAKALLTTPTRKNG